MNKTSEQLALPFTPVVHRIPMNSTGQERLSALLNSDLNFHDKNSSYGSHNFHSFPAKFPPQLPRKFIESLTEPGDLVLDPMSGSGTTILEAYLSGRQAIGFDIDPLALIISRVKVTPLEIEKLAIASQNVLTQARNELKNRRQHLEQARAFRWDDVTLTFIDYWFAKETQFELLALIQAIEQVADANIRLFLQTAFSATIITKTGGVSLALDLAHTRPHRAKIVRDANGIEVFREIDSDKPLKRPDILTKTLRSPLIEFEKRYRNNLRGICPLSQSLYPVQVSWGDAQRLALPEASVDLIVTSPPYASNAIDYMRAHKFSLVWLGYPLNDLGKKRKEYIGGESTSGLILESLPVEAAKIVAEISALDPKKGLALHRYYSEMTGVLREMYRVLKPGKSAIVVVGSSVMRNVNTQTQHCLEVIGRQIGFEVPKIGVRNLDRDRRMLPAGTHLNLASQIQQRIHEEFVIGFYKSGGSA